MALKDVTQAVAEALAQSSPEFKKEDAPVYYAEIHPDHVQRIKDNPKVILNALKINVNDDYPVVIHDYSATRLSQPQHHNAGFLVVVIIIIAPPIIIIIIIVSAISRKNDGAMIDIGSK